MKSLINISNCNFFKVKKFALPACVSNKLFSTQLSNRNLIMMKKLKNFRNNTLNVDLKGSDIIFQTIWSDFVHISLFDKNSENHNINTEFDYAKYDEESYTIFQDENIFTDFSETDGESVNLLSSENEIKITNVENKREIDLTLITRIPQEFNLNLKTDKNIKFVNTGDSKLIADKHISIEFYNSSTDKNETSLIKTFDAKRIRTSNFNLVSHNNIFIASIRSYLEAEFVNFISLNKSNIRLKKLGVVKEGFFHLKETNMDIRSIYGPVEKEKIFNSETINKNITFRIEGGNLNIGSIQGNVSFEFFDSDENKEFESNLFIDNLDCDKFAIKSEAENFNRCEMFINKINSSCVFDVKKVKHFIIFVNIDTKEDFVVKHNNSVIYGIYNKDKSVIEVNSETKPEIMEVSSWDYMKRRIEKKRMNKV